MEFNQAIDHGLDTLNEIESHRYPVNTRIEVYLVLR